MSLDWGLDGEDEQVAAMADNRLADILAADAAYVLQQLRGLAGHDAAFAGTMDLEGAGIAGHSRGGKTVGRACSSYPAFKACAVIDNVAYDVELAATNHFTCTDLPLFIPDLRVAGIDPVDGIDTCAAILADFFDAYLRHRISADETWMPTGQPDGASIKRFSARPGVVNRPQT